MPSIEAFVKDYLSAYTPYKSYWNYEDSCILVGCIDLYEATGDAGYRQFVLDYMERFVQPDGSIPNFRTDAYSIDNLAPGRALFFALAETGDERYRKAIEFHMHRLKGHPRCRCGCFWHKESYPNQVWLDGLYMAQPFYMTYERQFDKYANLRDITAQFATVRRQLYNPEKGLSYHAWDEARVQPWANKETGCSPNFWLRSMGWYLMAMIDCIEQCDEMLYEHYRQLVDQFRESIQGILRWQAEDGLFFQVIDRADVEGNYTETSGSSMVAYALYKGVRLGVLDAEEVLPVADRVWQALITEKLITGEDGETHLKDICRVAGLGPGEKRDGSVAYYLSEERCCDDAKGVGPFMMAWSEALRRKQ